MDKNNLKTVVTYYPGRTTANGQMATLSIESNILKVINENNGTIVSCEVTSIKKITKMGSAITIYLENAKYTFEFDYKAGLLYGLSSGFRGATGFLLGTKHAQKRLESKSYFTFFDIMKSSNVPINNSLLWIYVVVVISLLVLVPLAFIK